MQTQFASDSQAAYINKMLAGKQIGQNLSQLGLNTSGFGVGQQYINEAAAIVEQMNMNIPEQNNINIYYTQVPMLLILQLVLTQIGLIFNF